MAQQVTSDAYLLGIYKTWYTEEGVENLLFRNDPFVKEIKKERIGGKEYAFSLLYGRGGAVAGDFTVAVAAATSTSRNAEMKVPPGQIFSAFVITQKEKLASMEKRGAYTPALIDKMFAATEALRKTLAASFYGMGYGEIGPIPAAGVLAGASTFTFLNYDPIMKIDIGTQFEVTSTSLPSSALVAGGPFTVTAISGKTITFSPVAPAGGFAAASVVELAGSRDSGGNPNLPMGLAAWIPYLADRTGATWTTYIGTSFYGVTRSVAVEKLAGQWYVNAGGEKTYQVLTNLIRLLRSAGAVPDSIIINSEDYAQLITDLNAAKTYFQSINTSPDKSASNEVEFGLAKFGVQFESNWVKNVYETPYCPKGYAWVGEKDAIKFVGLSNMETPVNDGIAGTDPGSQKVDGVNAPDVDQYKFIIDDYLQVQPATATADGPGALVSLSLYANLVVTNPAHWGVCKF